MEKIFIAQDLTEIYIEHCTNNFLDHRNLSLVSTVAIVPRFFSSLTAKFLFLY